jgi:hypothetical protein
MKNVRLYIIIVITLLLNSSLVFAQDESYYPRDNDEDYSESYYKPRKSKVKSPTVPVAPAVRGVETDGSQNKYAIEPFDNDSDYKPPVQKEPTDDNFYPTYLN